MNTPTKVQLIYHVLLIPSGCFTENLNVGIRRISSQSNYYQRTNDPSRLVPSVGV